MICKLSDALACSFRLTTPRIPALWMIAMAFELDHLFIMTDAGAAVADRLVSLGLTEGSSNVHPGQGTENRRFFFRNSGLELLWVSDADEAQSEAIRRTHLWERWEKRQQICPFGICVRPPSGGSNATNIPFPHWDFCPPYLPARLSIAVGNNSENDAEPMLFQTPFGKRPDSFPPEKAQPLEHGLGLREVTRVNLISPNIDAPSESLQAAVGTGVITLSAGEAYTMELGFDHEMQGQQIDLRPDLPLVMRW